MQLLPAINFNLLLKSIADSYLDQYYQGIYIQTGKPLKKHGKVYL